MRAVLLSVALAVAGCAAQSDTGATTATSDLDVWLTDACPDGRRVAVLDKATGELLGTVACEDLRERAVEDTTLRAGLAAGPERVGEAREPLFLSLLCGLGVFIASLPVTDAICSRHPEDPKCSWGVGGGFNSIGLLCALLP